MMPRYHNSEVTSSKILANMAKTATPFPIYPIQNLLLRKHGLFTFLKGFLNSVLEPI